MKNANFIKHTVAGYCIAKFVSKNARIEIGGVVAVQHNTRVACHLVVAMVTQRDT